MKTPMTFRLLPDIADYLRSTGNQAVEIEMALRRSRGFRDWVSKRVMTAKQEDNRKMSDKGYLLPAILIGSDPASKIHANARISVGFGDAKLTRDGETIWSENMDPGHGYEDCMSVAEAEELAKANPDHDWRIVIYGPLRGVTYQRHGDMQWMLVEKNDGFA